MITRKKQKQKEMTYISMSNARSDPWAMVIVNFNTESTLFAVKSPRWSENITGATVCHYVIFIDVFFLNFNSMLVILVRKISKLLLCVKLFSIILLSYVLRSELGLNCQHVFLIYYPIIFLLIWLILRNIKLYQLISIYVYNYSWIC